MKRQSSVAALLLLSVAGVAIASGAGLGAVGTARAQAPAVTAANWGDAVGFRPDLSALPVPAGSVIRKDNVGQVKALLPPGLELLVREYGLELRITAYQPYAPSQAYIEATQRQRGKAKAWDVGAEFRKSGWSGYVSGLPFPKPRDGLQVAYNFLNAYWGDDSNRIYDVTWVSAERGVEATQTWQWLWLRTAHRTDVSPRILPEAGPSRWRSVSRAHPLEAESEPSEDAFYFESREPEDLKAHWYVSAMRRSLQRELGSHGDAWNATDYLFEDMRGYFGAAEWMHWKLVGQATMLLPASSGAPYGSGPQAVFETEAWPHWNPKVNWQLRPVYVLQVQPKLPHYPYGNMLVLVDAESYLVHYKEGYDRDGTLWKLILQGANPSPDPQRTPLLPGFGLALDLRAQHATLITYRKVASNSGLDAALLFPKRCCRCLPEKLPLP